MTLLSETEALIKQNKIENNEYGIEIKDPSEPDLQKNTIKDNDYQVSLDKNCKKHWDSYKHNNEIIGPSDFP